MEAPKSLPEVAKTALNWKLILMVAIIALIVTWLINRVTTTSLIQTDEEGNSVEVGTLKRSYVNPLKK